MVTLDGSHLILQASTVNILTITVAFLSPILSIRIVSIILAPTSQGCPFKLKSSVCFDN